MTWKAFILRRKLISMPPMKIPMCRHWRACYLSSRKSVHLLYIFCTVYIYFNWLLPGQFCPIHHCSAPAPKSWHSPPCQPHVGHLLKFAGKTTKTVDTTWRKWGLQNKAFCMEEQHTLMWSSQCVASMLDNHLLSSIVGNTTSRSFLRLYINTKVINSKQICQCKLVLIVN